MPPACIECNKPLPEKHYLCKTCQAEFCVECLQTHLKSKHDDNRPLLTPMGCVTCGGQIGGMCGVNRCPAPLCNNWGCREAHEHKHGDNRSDKQKEAEKNRFVN